MNETTILTLTVDLLQELALPTNDLCGCVYVHTSRFAWEGSDCVRSGAQRFKIMTRPFRFGASSDYG